MSASDIINAAKTAWDIIKDNAPSGDVTSSTANAVPHVDDWTSLTGAQGPNTKRWYYHVPYLDLPIMRDYDHVQFEILLHWEYGARYHGGGAFIPNIWVEVPDWYIGLGWHVDISLNVHNPSNSGSDTAPLARVPVTLTGTVWSVAESYRVGRSYVLYGDGNSERL